MKLSQRVSSFESMQSIFLTNACDFFFKLSSTIFFDFVSFTNKVLMKRFLVFLSVWLFAFSLSAQNIVSQDKSERLYSSALRSIDHNQFAAAREVFSEFIITSSTTDPRRAEAEYYKAFCALNLYHIDSEKQIANFIRQNPTDPKAITAYYELGKLLLC